MIVSANLSMDWSINILFISIFLVPVRITMIIIFEWISGGDYVKKCLRIFYYIYPFTIAANIKMPLKNVKIMQTIRFMNTRSITLGL